MVQPIATRGPGEEKREFLASTSNWFRPVNYANAPDGCLYILDMHREVIEHPWSIPEGIKKHLDLNSGWKRGAHFRVVPDGDDFKRRPAPKLSEASDEELVALLDHANGWHRTTAQRLLWQRGAWKKEYDQKGPRGDDPTPRVDFEAALAIGSGDSPDKMERLVETLREAPAGDPWMESAFLHGLRTPAEAAFAFVALDSIGRHSLALRVAEMAGQMGDDAASAPVFTKIDAAGPSARLALLAALARGAEKGGSAAKALILKKLEPHLDEAANLAASKEASSADRRAAVGLLRYAKDEASLELLRGMLGDAALASPALETLSSRRDPQLAESVVGPMGFPCRFESRHGRWSAGGARGVGNGVSASR